MHGDDCDQLEKYIAEMKFIPGGRYLYYAGRPARFYNNCYLLRADHDTREEWSALAQRAMSCLMTGGGIGIDYTALRGEGSALSRTGGLASGPIPLMHSINEIGRNVMQGGARRSAIYASLNWKHADAEKLLVAKNWADQSITKEVSHWDAKQENFNHAAPLDMTNVSLNYDDEWLRAGPTNGTFLKNCRQAMQTGEPGFSFNFGSKQNETLRNACTEVTSEDDSDVCNLGSINLGSIDSIAELYNVAILASQFLVCGTMRAELPYEKVYTVREKNRRLGLGLMGMHEWLLKRGCKYEVTPELHTWLNTYKLASESGANYLCDRLSISHPVAYRAIAPTGTIGILAGTTTGIEPLYAVAYKRRYLKTGTQWVYKYVIDEVAETLIQTHGIDPSKIDTASEMAKDFERRVKFQADVQDYVDMAISSTINLPAWGTEWNNEDRVSEFAQVLAKYAPRLRGFTAYPDGSRGGQPLTAVDYHEAKGATGVEFEENDSCKGGVCGI
jgi:ribonucleoside-diphosphate reductase alpha chain